MGKNYQCEETKLAYTKGSASRQRTGTRFMTQFSQFVFAARRAVIWNRSVAG